MQKKTSDIRRRVRVDVLLLNACGDVNW